MNGPGPLPNSFGKYHNVVKKADSDPDFKEQLLADPKGTLESEGFSFPDSVDEVKVIHDTGSTMHMVLPFDHGTGHELLDSWMC